MSDVIWVSDALSDSSLIYQFVPFLPGEDRKERWLSKNMDLMRARRKKYLNAELIPEELQYPTTHYLERLTSNNRQIDPLYHVFTNGCPFVSQTVRDIMEQFDLGQTAFLKVDLYRHDQKTRFEPDYYYLNIAEKKPGFVLEQCEGLSGMGGGDFYFSLLNPSVIAIERQMLDGVDLWMEPKIHGTVFFSDRLYQALKSAGCVDHMRFIQCKLVD